MIRFCDKEVYNIIEGEVTRTQLLKFFLENKSNRSAIVGVYNKSGSYKGIITYHALLESEELDECIDTHILTISEDFWKEATEFFRGGGDREINLSQL